MITSTSSIILTFSCRATLQLPILLVSSSLQAYCHFVSKVTCLWCLWSPSWMAPHRLAGPDAFASVLMAYSLQSSPLGHALPSPTAPSSGPLVLSAMALLQACLPQMCFCDWHPRFRVAGGPMRLTMGYSCCTAMTRSHWAAATSLLLFIGGLMWSCPRASQWHFIAQS
jgi:hypothetical protein